MMLQRKIEEALSAQRGFFRYHSFLFYSEKAEYMPLEKIVEFLHKIVISVSALFNVIICMGLIDPYVLKMSHF